MIYYSPSKTTKKGETKMGTHGQGNLYRARGRGKWRVRWMSNGQLHDVSTGTEDYEEAKKVAQRKTACFAELGDVKTLTAQLEKAKDRQAYLEARTNPSLTLDRIHDSTKSGVASYHSPWKEYTVRTP